MTRAAATIGLGLLVFACAGDRPVKTQELEVLVRAVSDDGEPIAAAPVTAGGAVVARTGAGGAVLVVLRRRDSVREQVAVSCPEGYDSPPAQAIRIGAFRRLDAPAERMVEMRFECRARARTAVLVVRTGGAPRLPVRVHGEEIARTDARGVAHVPLRMDRSSTLRVTLDTGREPLLRPQNPTATFSMRDRDAVLVFAQDFTRPEPPRRKRARVRRPPPAPARPVRIE